jgi:DNA processing protein
LAGLRIEDFQPLERSLAVFRQRLRNRVIAALSRAVIVVEAAVTGGALITATKAMEYGISVFAVPGDVDRETSVSLQGTCW